MPKRKTSYRWRARQPIAAIATLLCVNLTTPLPSHAYVAEIAAAAAQLLSLVSRFLPSSANPADIAAFHTRQMMVDMHARFDDFELALARTEQAIALLPETWRNDLTNTFRERDHADLLTDFGEIEDYMSVAIQGHKPLVSPNIEQTYQSLRDNARDLMNQPFDFWSLPILLAAFSYEYRIHHAFKIPNETTLIDDLDTVAEEQKKLREERQQYIRTAKDNGKLMAATDPDGGLYVRLPLPVEHRDDVATALKDYTERRERLKSRFTAAYSQLQAYRETVREELETVGDRYSDYFNQAPENFRVLMSEASIKGRRQSDSLAGFRSLVLRQFRKYDDADIRLVASFRHHYLSDFLPKACRRAKFEDTVFCAGECQAQHFFYWETADWAEIDNILDEYHCRLNTVHEKNTRQKDVVEGEMEGYSFYLGIVDTKLKILDRLYGIIPPGIDDGSSFNFNELSVGGSVMIGERKVFEEWVKTARNNLEQQKDVLEQTVNVEYRRLADSIEKFRGSIPHPGGDRQCDGDVSHWDLATTCCHELPDMLVCRYHPY